MYQEWVAEEMSLKKIDFGHEPMEIVMDMEYDTLKALDKAIQSELKFREIKEKKK